MKQVAIVGSHRETLSNAPFDDAEIEIWGFNSSAMTMKRIDRAFQMHEKWIIAGEKERYKNWLGSCDIPIYTKEKIDSIPTSTEYPFDDIFRMTEHVKHRDTGLKYFTSSVPMAIALAVLENRPKIHIYGIELSLQDERELQRDCFTFWVGFAAGKGIELNINCADGIFQKPIYGSEIV